jgi:predicted transcriptional regulator
VAQLLMKKHLAIMNKSAAEAVLSGLKTIETRFSQNRIPPFNTVSAGDLVYIKPPGEDIIGQFRVKKVIFYDNLEAGDLEKIRSEYGKEISMGDKELDQKYWQDKKTSRFGTLIFIAESERFITSPVKIKKSDMRGWLVLE